MKCNSRPSNDRRKPNAKKGSRFRSDSGQSIVEVALLTPLLLLLLVGVIEIGRYASQAIAVGNAARAGVAYGAQDHFAADDPAGITDAACQDFQGANTCGLTVSKAYVCQCDDAGTVDATPIDCSTGSCPAPSLEVVSLQVTASGSFSSLFSYPGIPSSLAVTRTATMRIWK